jgi:hypothetical protein
VREVVNARANINISETVELLARTRGKDWDGHSVN